jgi:hypothetical protein
MRNPGRTRRDGHSRGGWSTVFRRLLPARNGKGDWAVVFRGMDRSFGAPRPWPINPSSLEGCRRVPQTLGGAGIPAVVIPLLGTRDGSENPRDTRTPRALRCRQGRSLPPGSRAGSGIGRTHRIARRKPGRQEGRGWGPREARCAPSGSYGSRPPWKARHRQAVFPCHDRILNVTPVSPPIKRNIAYRGSEGA